MPYRLRKAPKRELYWVVAQDGQKKSKDPIPLDRAKAQMRALYAAENQETKGGKKKTAAEIAEYNAKLEAQRQQRESANKGAMRCPPGREYDPNKEYRGDENVCVNNPDGTITYVDLGKMDYEPCYVGKNFVGNKSPEECKQLNAEAFAKWEKEKHPENYYFFRPAVKGLLTAADFAAENIAPLLPGVGKLAGEVYKGVRQAVGPTEYDGMGKMHFVKARRVGGRRIAQRLHGQGWFSDAWSSVKRLATGAVERAKAVFKGVRQDYPPSVRKTLASVGNLPVVEMVIRRDPIQSLLNKALNLISLGKWDQLRREYHYDELFHLGVEVTVRISEANQYVRRYVIEKNEVINVAPAKAYTEKTQTWRVPMNGTTTIDTLLANTQLVMGSNFFPYDPFKNNCQDFIWSLLVANGYATPELKEIVKQPITDLVAKLPSFTGKVAKAVTDIGAIANVALEGQGREKQTDLAKSILVRNMIKKNIKDLGDEYVRLYLSGDIAGAEELYKLIKDGEKGLAAAQDKFAFSELPGIAPGAAADWSNPKRGKGSCGCPPSDKPMTAFQKQLKAADVCPTKYLKMAQRFAQRAGYPYKKIGFSDKAGKKLMIESPSGRPVHFGAVNHGDFVLYSLQGNKRLADEKRRLYLSRAQKIKGDWREDKYSPNNLAIWILWPPK